MIKLQPISENIRGMYEGPDGVSEMNEASIADDVCNEVLNRLGLTPAEQDAVDAAIDYCNEVDKSIIVQRLAERGVDISDGSKRLADNWMEVSIAVLAVRPVTLN